MCVQSKFTYDPLQLHRVLPSARNREEEAEEGGGSGGEVPGDQEQTRDAEDRGQGQEEAGQARQERLPARGGVAHG